MNLKKKLKNIVEAIKYQDIAQEQRVQKGKAISVISLMLSVISAVMSFMNFFQHHYEMLVATIILTSVFICIFIFSFVEKLRQMIYVIFCVVMSLLCLYFALTGGNDGFAILWVLLLPPSTMLLIEFIYGIFIGVFFEIFFIVLFWTPLGNIVDAYYSPTFMLRFPMLYTSFFLIFFFTKYLLAKQEMTEHSYLLTIERLSMIDKLTNIHNRRYFEDRLRREWNRSIRNNEPISVFIIDVDNFKNYNDTYGHLQGDKALQAVANVFAGVLKRSEDFAARWGGEEFIVLLSNTEGSKAFEMAERIRLQVAGTQIPLADGQTTYLTISTGVNSLTPRQDSSTDDFIRSADDALYAAKHNGKNRVCGPI